VRVIKKEYEKFKITILGAKYVIDRTSEHNN
jgi:hypothetical protein